MFEFFDKLQETTCYSNQFHYGEKYLRVDGDHFSKFTKKNNGLVSFIKEDHEDSNYLEHVCDLLILLPRLKEFWKKG